MHELQSRYAASQVRLLERAVSAAAAAGVDFTHDAAAMAERFGISRKKRAAAEYTDVASHLLKSYPSEVAYFLAVELTEQFESRLGYPPIGQIMVAMEEQGSAGAARWIACSLRNFPRVETAQMAFGVIRSSAMRSLVRADLMAEDVEVGGYISAGKIVEQLPKPALPVRQTTYRTKVEPPTRLSDGIERMPRRLTDAERRGNSLFLHLQVLSWVLLFLCPILGAVLRGWIGATIGLVVGWLLRMWMRRSMGLRGSDPNDSFLIRMKERANGARRGLLEAVIENVRQRPFTEAQCAAITQAWDKTLILLGRATSETERRAVLTEFDAQLKHISYGQDG